MTDAMGQYMTEMFSNVAADGSTLSIATVTVTVDMSCLLYTSRYPGP